MIRFLPSAAGILTVVLIATATTPSWAVDSVVRRSDNVTFRGEIIKADNSSVVVKRASGQEETVSVANLKSVQFDGEPRELGSARANERSAQYETALEQLAAAKSAYTGARREILSEIEFLTARVLGRQALTDPSKIDAAMAALEKFRLANKSNFRYLEATLLQAALHREKKEAAAGKALLTEVQASSVKGYQLQAGVDLGRLLLADGDTAGALAAFEAVVAQSQGDDDAAAALYDGMLGTALCYKQQNNIDEALKTLDEVIAKAGPSETRTLAEAWVRKGDCYRQKNETKPALMAYLHVDVLYPGESAQHAEALLRLSQLWGPTGHEDRAVDASTRLAQQYPNSEWAKQTGSGG